MSYGKRHYVRVIWEFYVPLVCLLFDFVINFVHSDIFLLSVLCNIMAETSAGDQINKVLRFANYSLMIVF